MQKENNSPPVPLFSLSFPFIEVSALCSLFLPFILLFLPGDVCVYQGSYRHTQPHLCQIFAPGRCFLATEGTKQSAGLRAARTAFRFIQESIWTGPPIIRVSLITYGHGLSSVAWLIEMEAYKDKKEYIDRGLWGGGVHRRGG